MACSQIARFSEVSLCRAYNYACSELISGHLFIDFKDAV